MTRAQQKQKKTPPPFPRRFRNPEACLATLQHLRLQSGFKCGDGASLVWPRPGKWRCPACGTRGSVTKGTIFEGSANNISKWFRAIWLVTSRKYGCSALELQERLGLAYSTAYEWRSKIRNLMGKQEPLEGDIELEVVQLPKDSSMDGAPQHIVLIALQRETAMHFRIRLASPANAEPALVNSTVTSIIKPGSLVRTTKWPGFAELRKEGYDHRAEGAMTGLGDTLTDRAAKIWRELDRWLTETFRGAVQGLNPYLAEYAFRYNQHLAPGDDQLFMIVLKLAASITTY